MVQLRKADPNVGGQFYGGKEYPAGQGLCYGAGGGRPGAFGLRLGIYPG